MKTKIIKDLFNALVCIVGSERGSEDWQRELENKITPVPRHRRASQVKNFFSHQMGKPLFEKSAVNMYLGIAQRKGGELCPHLMV